MRTEKGQKELERMKRRRKRERGGEEESMRRGREEGRPR